MRGRGREVQNCVHTRDGCTRGCQRCAQSCAAGAGALLSSQALQATGASYRRHGHKLSGGVAQMLLSAC